MPKFRAIVLLSAYGCSDYLADQVKSIANQMTMSDLLVIVDDFSGSVDWEKIENHLPPNYHIWTRLKNLGSSLSFIDLLMNPQWDGGQYYFFADQDDVWLEGKIEQQAALTPSGKMSVHTVLEDWSSFNGRKIPNKLSKILPKKSSAHFFFETPAPGMTMCLGGKFRENLKRSESDLCQAAVILPHDRIIAGCAGFLDLIVFIDVPLARYRQHDSNQIGAFVEKNIIIKLLSHIKISRKIVRQVQASNKLLGAWSLQKIGNKISDKSLMLGRIRENFIENIIIKIIIFMF